MGQLAATVQVDRVMEMNRSLLKAEHEREERAAATAEGGFNAADFEREPPRLAATAHVVTQGVHVSTAAPREAAAAPKAAAHFPGTVERLPAAPGRVLPLKPAAARLPSPQRKRRDLANIRARRRIKSTGDIPGVSH